MKFYRYVKSGYYLNKIINNNLIAIYVNSYKHVLFFKNGKKHNPKNAADVKQARYKSFCLNNKCYGYEYNFTKESWRIFVRTLKLKAFL